MPDTAPSPAFPRGSPARSGACRSFYPIAQFQRTAICSKRGRSGPRRLRPERLAMPTDIRPRRSVLYMPGANARALDKARGLAADGLIFDLEDAVLPDAKPGARRIVQDRILEIEDQSVGGES